MRRLLGLAVALVAVVTLIIWGAWLAPLPAGRPAIGPGHLLLLGLVVLVVVALLVLTRRS
jgi:hypothetical protein